MDLVKNLIINSKHFKNATQVIQSDADTRVMTVRQDFQKQLDTRVKDMESQVTELVKEQVAHELDEAKDGLPYDPSRIWREDQFKTANMTDFLRVMERYIWTYTAVNAIGSNAAKIPLRFWKLKPDGTRGDEVKDGWPWSLFNRPNKYMSYFDFQEAFYSFAELTGNSYVEKDNPDKPQQMYILRPDFVSVIPDCRELLKGYTYEPDGVPSATFEPDEILHYKYFHPRSELYGLGPVQPVESSIVLDFYAVGYQVKWFKKGGMIGQYGTTKKELNRKEFKRLRQELEHFYAGVDSSRSLGLFDNELEIKSALPDPDKTFLKAQRDMNRDEVLASHGVPPIMIAFLAGLETYNNTREQKVAFWDNTMRPKLMKGQDQFNAEICWPNGFECEYDFSGIPALQPDEEKKAKTATMLVKDGIFTPNEARKKFYELEEMDGGNILRQPTGFALRAANGDEIDIVPDKRIEKQRGAKSEWKRLYPKNEENTWKKVSKIFDDWSDRVIDNLSKTVKKEYFLKAELEDDALKGIKAIEEELLAALVAANTVTATEFARSVYKRHTGEALAGETATKVGNAIERNVDRWAKKSADEIVDTMSGRVKNYLKQAAKVDADIGTMTENIQRIFKGDPSLRPRDQFPWARTVARTESGFAGNFAKDVVGKELKHNRKQWIWSGLERETHNGFDAGGTVPLEHIYPDANGPMRFPHDPDGHVGDRANCACTFDTFKE